MGAKDTCVVQVREHPKAPWRTVASSSRALAWYRYVGLLEQYPAARVVEDGTVLYSSESAPGDQACPKS